MASSSDKSWEEEEEDDDDYEEEEDDDDDYEEEEQDEGDDDYEEEEEDEGEGDEKEENLEYTGVFSKYQAAAVILEGALREVLTYCTPKAKVVDICEKGDSLIIEKTGRAFKSTASKGIAFPTCLSVNKIVCHFSPLATDGTVLEENDIVKIEMACHIDGYIATVAHTNVVTNRPLTGRLADVICAANTAADVIYELVKPGTKMKDVSEAIQIVARAFHCNVLEAFRSHQLKRFDEKKPLPSVSDVYEETDDYTFEANRAYAIDIALTTGGDKLKSLDENHTMIYKSIVGDQSQLEALRPVFSEINKKFKTMPFCARSLEEDGANTSLAGTNHDILLPYPVLCEESGGIVAHIKFTLLVMQKKTSRITTYPVQDLRPMFSVETNAEIMKLRGTIAGKGKGQGSSQLHYCGRLPIGRRSSGVKPIIFDISWSKVPVHCGASEALACTGTFGTCVYRCFQAIKDMKLKGNIEDGWKKEILWETPGRFCKWSPNGKFLAVGVVREADLKGEVYILHGNDLGSGAVPNRIYEATKYSVGLNSLSWSHNSKYLVLGSQETHHVVVIKTPIRKLWVQTVRFSSKEDQMDSLVAVFHPKDNCFIAASSTGCLRCYKLHDEQYRSM